MKNLNILNGKRKEKKDVLPFFANQKKVLVLKTKKTAFLTGDLGYSKIKLLPNLLQNAKPSAFTF